MNPAIKMVAVAAMVLGISANANVRRVVPYQMADLAETTSAAVPFPRAERLVKHVRVVSKKVELFSLVEDTGIRCRVAPCPSEQTSIFRVTEVKKISRNHVVYKAIEELFLEPGVVGPLKRVMEVNESIGTEDEGDSLWEVSIMAYGYERTYEGYVSPVRMIQ